MKLTFTEASHGPEAFSRKFWIAKGLTKEQARQTVEEFQREKVYLSDCGTYQVNVAHYAAKANWPAMIHLSIKRRDKEAFHDWRILQSIKNAILSPEHEAVELYPAESRLVDTANQYHLWALADPTMQFPFGWTSRLVDPDGTMLANLGGKQRPIEPTDGR